ncbi:MAG: hypothetical protein HY077_18005 [Elusimicrobia bacterium]|nr:hypothetical protein [Elusimicrobiota bacterium]
MISSLIAFMLAVGPSRAAEVRILELRPTQFAVGEVAVQSRALELKGMEGLELGQYLVEHPVPIVVGPASPDDTVVGTALYMIDRHHLARAAAETGIPSLPVKPVADWSAMGWAQFWDKMQEMNWTYLYDGMGEGPLSPDTLPRNVMAMPDDPVRSVTTALKGLRVITKSPKPHAENHYWVPFLRRRMKTADINANFDAAVTEATALSESRAAWNLPGARHANMRSPSEAARGGEAALLEFRPTQLIMGERTVRTKVDELKEIVEEGDIRRHLVAHPVPVIIGPGGSKYMLDRHHRVRAAWEAGLVLTRYVVKADWSKLSEAEFEERMKRRGLAYLLDEHGAGPVPASRLPRDVRGLVNDPVRSVVDRLVELKVIRALRRPHSENAWVAFFHKNLKTPDLDAHFDEAVAEAAALARSPAASYLPGYLHAPRR